MKEPILVMMAAGMGSRYGGLKQLDPVGPDGEVILDYSLYDAYQAGFRRFVSGQEPWRLPGARACSACEYGM